LKKRIHARITHLLIRYNKAGVEVKVRKCLQPEAKLHKLHQALGIKSGLFTKVKSVVHNLKFPKLEIQNRQAIGSG